MIAVMNNQFESFERIPRRVKKELKEAKDEDMSWNWEKLLAEQNEDFPLNMV